MKKVNRLIQDNFLNERLHQFDQLTQLISDFMLLPLENRVWPIIRGRRLILLTDDPHLATQARFMAKQLCNHLKEQTGHKINSVDIKLMSLPLVSYKGKLGRNKISAQSAEVISSIATSIEDQELQEVLERLSKQAEQ